MQDNVRVEYYYKPIAGLGIFFSCHVSTDSQRVAVFCLMKLGSEIFDTEMVIVDRTVTDICFEGVTIL